VRGIEEDDIVDLAHPSWPASASQDGEEVNADLRRLVRRNCPQRANNPLGEGLDRAVGLTLRVEAW